MGLLRVFALIALIAAPAFAQSPGRYEDAQSGYSIALPEGFVAQENSSHGQSFYRARGAQAVTVWGGDVVAGFEATVADAMDQASVTNGWNISDQAVTPRWAEFRAVKGSRMLFQRMVLLCDGARYAAFRAEYSAADVTEMDGVVDRLVQSLRGNGC